MNNCIVCGSDQVTIDRTEDFENIQYIGCPHCGKYKTTNQVATSGIKSDLPLHIRAGVVRHLNLIGKEVEIKRDNFEELASNLVIPSDPLDAMDILVWYIYKKTDKAGQSVEVVSTRDYPITYSKDAAECTFILGIAQDMNYIEKTNGNSFRLTAEGWNYINELKKQRISSNQAFVGMWFNDKLVPAWNDGFKPALEAVGYNPIRIDMVPHNEDINDRIIAEIRKSSLMVADFTGQRNGVYFEAGFAMGLGIPLIRTCRADEIDDLHFDTEHYFHIEWENPEELYDKLKTHIEATIPGAATAEA